jgi:hypothetical protein
VIAAGEKMKTRIDLTILLVVLSFCMSACGSGMLFGPTPTPTPIPPTPTPTPPPCALKCNIDTQGYGFEISCESGKYTEQLNNKTRYEYALPPNDNIKSHLILELNQERTYESTKNKYSISGTIVIGLLDNTAGYSIKVTGGVFGDTPQICEK